MIWNKIFSCFFDKFLIVIFPTDTSVNWHNYEYQVARDVIIINYNSFLAGQDHQCWFFPTFLGENK